MELRAGRPGKADATRLRGVFQRYSDVNPIALEISVVPDEHVAEMDAHAEQHSPILGYIGVAISGNLLHIDRASHRIFDTGKLDQHAVAEGFFDDAAAIFLDLRGE
jgi:hypothetical protein